MAPHSFFSCTFLTLFLCFHGITAVDYRVINDAPTTPGGIRFTNEIGIPYTKQIMGTINNFIWSVVFQQTNPSDQKQLDFVNTYIVEFDGAEAISWGNNNINLIEGIADYTKLKANYAQDGFAKPGQGDRWDQGYDFTARFLEYCDGLVPGFVAKLNKMMRVTYNVKYFEDLTGKPVDQLWQEYKAKYSH
ncbi:hypothetical protein L6452_28116 [Arctium lappa]|uniref:Uncharacterized protein n=1 Tax=Arctium lappa TaxID=4217 RepID=A0ACB8ZXF0_ARCLA|nr:hypothetical protein L6452_28116 [Arctium lappa]